MPPPDEEHTASPPSPAEPGSAAALSFEQALAALERVVRDLEEGQLDLTEALARYEEGIRYLKHCYQILQQAEQRVELLTAVTADGSSLVEPFHEAPTLDETTVTRRRRARRQ